MIKIPAYFTGFTSKSDKSLSLKFETQELSGEQLLMLQQLNQSYGWLLYKENEADTLQAPEEEAPKDENEVSPSKRLYNRMFVFFKEKKIAGDFTVWRNNELEKIGNKYLNAIV